MADIQIRLESTDPEALAAVDAAIRRVLDVPAPSRAYQGRRQQRGGRGRTVGQQPDPTQLWYLRATGITDTNKEKKNP